MCWSIVRFTSSFASSSLSTCACNMDRRRLSRIRESEQAKIVLQFTHDPGEMLPGVLTLHGRRVPDKVA
jgi:hypothetical protein